MIDSNQGIERFNSWKLYFLVLILKKDKKF